MNDLRKVFPEKSQSSLNYEAIQTPKGNILDVSASHQESQSPLICGAIQTILLAEFQLIVNQLSLNPL